MKMTEKQLARLTKAFAEAIAGHMHDLQTGSVTLFIRTANGIVAAETFAELKEAVES